MFVNFVNYSLVIVLSVVYVNSQLCLTRSTVTKHLLMKRWTTIGEAKVIQKCCEGYSQENYNGGIICTPLCKSNCINGYCDKPDQCACDAGYLNQSNTCVPVCEEDCSHGTCIFPDMCLCFPGYNRVNGTCLPRCTKPCGNGTCVAPETCEGWVKSETETTTTTRNPLILMSTHKYRTADTATSSTTTRTPTTTTTPTTTSTSTTTSTTTTPYFVSSSSSTEGVLDNNRNNNVTSADPGDKTWLQRNGIFIWLPILLILLIIVLLLLRKVIINYLKGVKNRRSYNVKAAFRKRAASAFKSQPPQKVKEAQV